MHPRAIDESPDAFAQNWRPRANSCGQATERVIGLYCARLEGIQAAELKRLSSRLPDLQERSWLEVCQFAERLVGTMLGPPLESLRDESRNGSPQALLDALQRLFQLTD
jgi:glutamyl-tRNA reductase